MVKVRGRVCCPVVIYRKGGWQAETVTKDQTIYVGEKRKKSVKFSENKGGFKKYNMYHERYEPCDSYERYELGVANYKILLGSNFARNDR